MFTIIILVILLIGYYHYFYNKPAGYSWGTNSSKINWSAINASISRSLAAIPHQAAQLNTNLATAVHTSTAQINTAVSNITGIPIKMLSDSPITGKPVLANGFKILGGPLLTIAQIVFVDDSGQALQYGNFKNIRASSTYKSYTTPDNAIDGNTYFTAFPHVWHPSGADTNAWMSADFDSDKKISKIVIYNRSDCCQDRINEAHCALTLNGDIVFNKTLTTANFVNNICQIVL